MTEAELDNKLDQLVFSLVFVNRVTPEANGYSSYSQLKRSMYLNNLSDLKAEGEEEAKLYIDLEHLGAVDAVAMMSDVLPSILDIIESDPELRSAILKTTKKSAA